MAKRALLLVDIQNDFLEGGSLAVPNAHEILPIACKLIREHNRFFDEVIATQDWHPADHRSFVSQHPGRHMFEEILLDGKTPQRLWPVHCVQESFGAELAKEIRELMPLIDKIVFKGTDRFIDSYSAFRDNCGDKETDLRTYLEEKKITDVYVMGLATDFCVRLSAEDSRRLNFNTFLIKDGCRGIDEAGINEAYTVLEEKSVRMVDSKNCLS